MHADAAVTGLSRTPATALRNTVQPLADVVNVTLKSRSGQTANHIEGRSFASVLQWSISAVGFAFFSALSVTGNSNLGTVQFNGVANHSADLVFDVFSNQLIRTDVSNSQMHVTGGSTIANGANLALYSVAHSTRPGEWALRVGTTDIFALTAAGLVAQPLAGVGTRFVTADASGVLGSTSISGAGGVLGTGAANRVAYWSAADTITSSANLTFNGTDLIVGASGTLTLGYMTITRIPFAGVGGILTASSNLTYTTGTTTFATANATFSGTLIVTGIGTFSSRLNIGGAVDSASFPLNVAGGAIAVNGGNSILSYAVGNPGDANYERMSIIHTGTAAELRSQASGTGTVRPLRIVVGSTTRYEISAAGAHTVTGAVSMSTTLAVLGVATIGTAGSAANNLVVNGYQVIQNTLGNSAEIFLTTTGGTGVPTSWRILSLGSAQGVLGTPGSLVFYNGTTSTVVGRVTAAGAWTLPGTLDVTGNVTLSAGMSVAGRVSIGSTIPTSTGLEVTGTIITAGTTQVGFRSQVTFSTAATVAGKAVYVLLQTAAGAFTMATGYGIQIDSPAIGAGSAITTAYGLKIENWAAGGTNFAIHTGTGAISFGDTTTWRTAGSGADASIWKSAGAGLSIRGVAGSSYDFSLFTPAATYLIRNPTGTQTLEFPGTAGNTFTANITLGLGTAAPAFIINGAAANGRQVLWQTAGLARWAWRVGAVAESGSDAGSEIALKAYNDAGAAIDDPITIVRAAGGTITLARPVSFSSSLSITGQFISTASGGGSSAGIMVSAAAPSFGLRETDQASDAQYWDILANGGVLSFRTTNNANSTSSTGMTMTRTAASITAVAFPVAVTLSSTLTGTGNWFYTGTAHFLGADTSDGSDNKSIALSGGGGTASSSARGASLLLAGNEHANTGLVQINCGNVTGATVNLLTGGTTRFAIPLSGNITMLPASGIFALTGAQTISSTLAVTSAITATGGIIFAGGGSTLNHYETGSYTATLTGCTTSPTVSVNYVRIGNMVMLHFPNSLTASSNTTSCTLTGAPTAIRPASAQGMVGIYTITDGSGAIGGVSSTTFAEMGTGGTITLYWNNSPIGFNNAGGNKGLRNSQALGAAGFNMCYCMT